MNSWMEVSVGDEKAERRYVVLEDNEVLWFDKPMVRLLIEKKWCSLLLLTKLIFLFQKKNI